MNNIPSCSHLLIGDGGAFLKTDKDDRITCFTRMGRQRGRLEFAQFSPSRVARNWGEVPMLCAGAALRKPFVPLHISCFLPHFTPALADVCGICSIHHAVIVPTSSTADSWMCSASPYISMSGPCGRQEGRLPVPARDRTDGVVAHEMTILTEGCHSSVPIATRCAYI